MLVNVALQVMCLIPLLAQYRVNQISTSYRLRTISYDTEVKTPEIANKGAKKKQPSTFTPCTVA